MSIELRVKNKHLALEAKVIKFEEARQKRYGNTEAVQSLCQHRKLNVRNENRATSLARAYIAGRPYKTVEQSRHKSREVNFWNWVFPRVVTMVQKYHDRKVTKEDIIAWMG